MDWLTRRPIAHRGLHGRWIDGARRPENTRAAFLAAIRHGYGIELDLVLSGDGVAMVFHDEALSRLTGRPGLAADHDAATLGTFAVLGTAETIPTLAQVVRLVDGRAPLVIEIKGCGALTPVLAEATARALHKYQGPHCIKSFDPAAPAWFRTHAPAVPRGLVAMRASDWDEGEIGAERARLLEQLADLDRVGASFVSYDINALPNRAVAQARASGRAVITWTVRNARQRARAAAFADNIVFENWLP
ncbi:glycerophosphodiester phosphodiesterase family protein [Zavarzinia sp. CC-PAN008]|uniref:glycerophosphodiester phosphodiesterase family protein n=1 Tax=Zavarzinia sp. CC-PAN008 TaxID=3243332 RepID=UPI003F7452AE